jgi:hypothetical protein
MFITTTIKLTDIFEVCNFRLLRRLSSGLSSSVGIETDYGLDGPGIERMQEADDGFVWCIVFHVNKKTPVVARYFVYFQTGPGAHPATCTMGTESFPGVKRPGCGADHPPPSSAVVENE